MAWLGSPAFAPVDDQRSNMDPNAANAAAVEDFIVQAVQKERDRIFVRHVEEELALLLRSDKVQISINSPTSYHRRLAHNIADRYQMLHVTDPQQLLVVITKIPNSRAPPVRFCDLAVPDTAATPDADAASLPETDGSDSHASSASASTSSSPAVRPVLRFMKREATPTDPSQHHQQPPPRPRSANSTTTAAAPSSSPTSAPAPTSDDPASSADDASSIEAREIEYEKARARIFADDNTPSDAQPKPTLVSNVTSYVPPPVRIRPPPQPASRPVAAPLVTTINGVVHVAPPTSGVAYPQQQQQWRAQYQGDGGYAPHSQYPPYQQRQGPSNWTNAPRFTPRPSVPNMQGGLGVLAMIQGFTQDYPPQQVNALMMNLRAFGGVSRVFSMAPVHVQVQFSSPQQFEQAAGYLAQMNLQLVFMSAV